MTTNSLNNECLEDFTVSGGASGALRSLRVENEYDVASSASVMEHYIAGTTADDPYTSCIVGATASNATGIDVDDSQYFKLGYAASAAATPSSTALLETDTSSRNFYPSQPCFKAHVSTQVDNVTGDGTVVTVPFNTEDFDIGSNYNNGTYIFTVPLDGRYMFLSCVQIRGIVAGITEKALFLKVNGTTVVANKSAAFGLQSSGSNMSWPIYATLDLSASDTVRVDVQCSNGAKVVDIDDGFGGSTNFYFSGYLLG